MANQFAVPGVAVVASLLLSTLYYNQLPDDHEEFIDFGEHDTPASTLVTPESPETLPNPNQDSHKAKPSQTDGRQKTETGEHEVETGILDKLKEQDIQKEKDQAKLVLEQPKIEEPVAEEPKHQTRFEPLVPEDNEKPTRRPLTKKDIAFLLLWKNNLEAIKNNKTFQYVTTGIEVVSLVSIFYFNIIRRVFV
eukprot:TRINITY_DN7822_c0_g1_i1.p1 TRINITY_DN7822_c0_g1~~TRINITY_DN7822_c0_g1_i1.p1  ORF type:complete len:204 (-),score=54.41 TRINITY_DN7822_c0_g1_i1:667-1245(-)